MPAALRPPAYVVGRVRNRLADSWAQELVDEVLARDGSSRWPHACAVRGAGAVDGTDWWRWAADWQDLVRVHDVTLRFDRKRVGATPVELPSHVVVPGIAEAARFVGEGWPERLTRGRGRAALLAAEFPGLVATGRLCDAVSGTDGLDEVDLDILVRAARWFAAHDATGLTPRQVPIEGAHAKWLNTRQGLVRLLAGKDDLALLPRHPARVHLTYLDPRHRAGGGRWHDSVTLGDAMTPAYVPRVVVISENKDTAIHFPAVHEGVSVEGVGRGGATIAAVEWLGGAPLVVYWGDMDADGLEILDGFRGAGIRAVSIFMDRASYEEWERFGTSRDRRGEPIRVGSPRLVPSRLTPAEAELYGALVSPGWTRHRRVEQERIPLDRARAEVLALVSRL